MNRNIIIAAIAIIAIAVVGAFVFSHPATTTDGKINTQINFLSGDTLQNGNQVQFELKDAQGNLLAEQTVAISYDDHSGNVQTYKIITDSTGKGYLTIDGEDAGTYDITITYDGNDKYNGCSAKQSITVEDGTYEEPTETTDTNSTTSTVMYNNGTTSSSSTPEQTYYDADLNVVFDSNGMVIGGQSEGSSIYDLRENQPTITEDGSLE